MPTISPEDLLQITPAANNGAPAHEPEVWDASIPAFNPLFAHTPEPPPLAVSPDFAAHADFNVEAYLAEEAGKDLLRFSTAGSVDDGKSTLIGRLLYDTQSVYDDQLRSIEGKGTTAPGVLDLALLTDGLRAEREQGITIDVAYRYFSTARRKFIIADTPGHEQYTRNMATGASTADVAIVLIDARKGVLTQSRRHAYITALLGVRHVIVAVNKMDLVAWSESTFAAIRADFTNFFHALQIPGHQATKLHFIPVSALAGDNVVRGSEHMPWYAGPTLLTLLETVPSSVVAPAAPFRFAVQRVVRPNLDFRGFAGQIAAGTVRVGDRIQVFPSTRTTRVARIVTFDGDLLHASAPLSVTLTFADEIDVSRGDLLASPRTPPTVTSAFSATLVWMDATPLDLARRYLLKHMSRTVPAQVRTIHSTVDLSSLHEAAHSATPSTLAMNGIATVSIEALQPLALDPYATNRTTGSFVLIDPQTNATVAAGIIRETQTPAAPATAAVTPAERAARYGHLGAHLALTGPAAYADALERALFALGANVIQLPTPDHAPTLAAAGLLVLTHTRVPTLSFSTGALTHTFPSDDIPTAVAETLQLLRTRGLLRDGATQ